MSARVDGTEIAEQECKPIASDQAAIVNTQTAEINKLKQQLSAEKAKSNISAEKIRELKAINSMCKLELQIAKNRLRSEKLEREILKSTYRMPNHVVPKFMRPVVPVTRGFLYRWPETKKSKIRMPQNE
uniref:Uncharacterized protein n=1 Tax=Ditylenchus dipsaci TaxID=166011 RepID=A0A915CMB2_9BILA